MIWDKLINLNKINQEWSFPEHKEKSDKNHHLRTSHFYSLNFDEETKLSKNFFIQNFIIYPPFFHDEKITWIHCSFSKFHMGNIDHLINHIPMIIFLEKHIYLYVVINFISSIITWTSTSSHKIFSLRCAK